MNEPKVITADCLEALRAMEDCSVDAVVTDPPYGLSNTKPAQVAEILRRWVTGDVEHVPEKRGGFMGQDWDSFVPPPAVWVECMRVLKPGGHMVVFAGARTQDLMGLSIRLAGFEIRDTLGWVYSQGFPKSMDVSKAIDKGQALTTGRAFEFTEWMRSTGITARQIDEATGTQMGSHYTTHPTQPAIATADLFDKLRPLLPEVPEYIERLVAERTGIKWTDYVKRGVVGRYKSGIKRGPSGVGGGGSGESITTSSTDAAKRWDGWGTALKPAWEPIILARKPLDGTVAANVLAHGVGGLNIDECRVPSDAPIPSHHGTSGAAGVTMGKYRDYVPGSETAASVDNVQTAGRFPANVLLDEHAAKEMDEQSGWQKDGTSVNRNRGDDEKRSIYEGGWRKRGEDQTYGGEGGASRFFPVFKYQAKAPKKERPVIVREAIYELRDDLTQEQVDHVLARLRESGVETG